MNRPTNDVDNLLAIANEALAAADTPQAITILRKAASIAPLRKDIRNRLAFALEQQPTSSKPTMVIDDRSYFEDYDESESYDDTQDTAAYSGRESIGQIARRAFEAASTQTSKASVARRRLTDLLHQGLESWKTVRVPKPVEAASMQALAASDPAPTVQDHVFAPNVELQSYMNRAEFSSENEDHDLDDAGDVMPMIESIRISKSNSKSNKASGGGNSRKSTKPKDMEDVIVAGIDSFIDVATRIEKKKVAYGLAYVAMAGLFYFACFDVSRKFPSTNAMQSGQSVAVASVGQFDLQSKVSEPGPTAKDGLSLDSVEDSTPDIDSLRQQLESTQNVNDRDAVRVKLTTILNKKGDKELEQREFQKSIATYQEAVKLSPKDSTLKVRLANALYYQATSNPNADNSKTEYLSTAAGLLLPIAGGDKVDVYALHLLALVQDARGNHKDAQTVWQKVKATAPQGSPIFREAESRLK